MRYGYSSPFDYNDLYKKFPVHHTEQHGELTKEFYLYPNGFPAQIIFKDDFGKIHNNKEDPAVIRFAFKTTGSVKTHEYYYDHDNIFLEKRFYINGNISSIGKYEADRRYRNMRCLHCSDGPAVIHFNRDGKIGDREYYCMNPYIHEYWLGKNLFIPDGPNSVMEYCANLKLLR